MSIQLETKPWKEKLIFLPCPERALFFPTQAANKSGSLSLQQELEGRGKGRYLWQWRWGKSNRFNEKDM